MYTRFHTGTPRQKRALREFEKLSLALLFQGTAVPCYVNVLSWEKITMPLNPSQPVRFYGGMRVRPPRTRTEAVVFAVMANPEVLRINGKNAQDPKVLVVHNCYT